LKKKSKWEMRYGWPSHLIKYSCAKRRRKTRTMCMLCKQKHQQQRPKLQEHRSSPNKLQSSRSNKNEQD
jgi:hypothetical protein